MHCNVAGPFWRILKKCKEPGEARFLAFFQNSPKRTCNGIANQVTPRRSPGAFLDPPPPKATPLDPLGIYRCLGYNFLSRQLIVP